MEREIKFRAYINKSKGIKEISQINYATKTIVTTDGYCYGFKDIILMQYTGLKDKNGKEIYEGDIVQAVFVDEEESKIKGVVVYVEAAACYMVIANNGDEWELGYLDEIEKIGNKWDNPELLEKGE